MIVIEIRFVSGLKPEDSIAENFLALRDNIQLPVGGVVPGNTF